MTLKIGDAIVFCESFSTYIVSDIKPDHVYFTHASYGERDIILLKKSIKLLRNQKILEYIQDFKYLSETKLWKELT